MKTLFILACLVLLASCGNSKLRFQRVSPFNKQKIVVIEDLERSSNQDRMNSIEESEESSNLKSISSELEETSRESGDVTLESAAPETLENKRKEDIQDIPIAYSDTLDGGENDTEENKAIALKAEKLSTIAIWLNRGALLILVLSGVFALLLFDAIPLLAGAIVGFIFGVTAIVLGFMSKAKSHNTEKGSRQASKAIIFGFVLTVALGFILLLTAGSI